MLSPFHSSQFFQHGQFVSTSPISLPTSILPIQFLPPIYPLSPFPTSPPPSATSTSPPRPPHSVQFRHRDKDPQPTL